MSESLNSATCCCCLPLKCGLQFAVVIGFLQSAGFAVTTFLSFKNGTALPHEGLPSWLKYVFYSGDGLNMIAAILGCIWLCNDTPSRRGNLTGSFFLNLLTVLLIGGAIMYMVCSTHMIED